MSRLSIRVRLTLGFAVAMAVVLAGVGLFVYQRVANELLASVDATLLAQAGEEIDSHHVDADTGGGTTLAQLYGPRGGLRASQPGGLVPLVDRSHLAAALAGQRVWLERRLPGRPGAWRVLVRPASGGGGAAVVARSLGPRDESLDHLRHELVLFLPLALLAACLGGYALTAGALRPVEVLRRRAAAVTAGGPSRLPVPPSGDEVSRLAETLNDMLARLHAAFEHERRFVADASHELRTPLALLRTELDLALRRPRSREELESALRSAAEETQRLSRLADDLLLIARADQGPLPMRREVVTAGELLDDAATRFANRATAVGRELQVEPSELHVDADPLRAGQALVNLVDNALTHGAGAIELSAEERDDLVELHVRDAGTGFPHDFRARAFDRFSRADEARGRGGSGLGLSIVELVARAHGGGVGLHDRPNGGADVWFSLPRADRPPAAQSGAFTAGDPGRRRTGLAAARQSGTSREGFDAAQIEPPAHEKRVRAP